jgi:two-component system NtrC family sensor kinase
VSSSPSGRVRSTLDALPGVAFQVTLDGSILDANAEAVAFFGYRFDDAVGRFVVEASIEVLREDGSPCPAHEEPLAATLSTGKASASVVLGYRRASGETQWALTRCSPLHDTKGALSGAVVVLVDVSGWKQTEEGLRRSEATWRSLAENLPDFVIMVDREARIQSINRILPHLADTRVIGNHAHGYINPDFLAEWKENFAAALSSGAPQRSETRAMGAGGLTVWYEQVFIPIVEECGRVDRVLIVARDITERRAMIARLAERERLASIGMLSASVAHEIMNPLTSVLANLDFAIGDRCPPGARKTKALLDARDGAACMQQIVWDLRTLNRAGTDEFFYVDVRSVIETALRLAGPAVAQNLSVVVDLDEVPGVLASESHLCQVFINLFVNAAQSMADRPVREIHIRTKTDDAASLVGVAISDTGVGIESEHLARIFDPFFTTKKCGTGLGLSLVKECIDRMGGRIEVDSQPGIGTTFTVWLSTTRAPTAKRASSHAPASSG